MLQLTSTQRRELRAQAHNLNPVVSIAENGLTKAVLAEMKKLPINDFMTKDGSVRPDGRVIRDMYLMEVKTPEESKSAWDLAKIVATVPGVEAFRPLDEGGCPLIAKK